MGTPQRQAHGLAGKEMISLKLKGTDVAFQATTPCFSRDHPATLTQT